jgi:hypothetical protein
MDGRTWADRLRVELENYAGMIANALMDRSKRRLVRDRQREVVQADVGLAIERDRVSRIRDTPDRKGYDAIGDEHGRVGLVACDFLKAQSAAEKTSGLVEVANGKADVVHAEGQSVSQRSILSSLGDDR